jgi:hypothetical protein
MGKGGRKGKESGRLLKVYEKGKKTIAYFVH